MQHFEVYKYINTKSHLIITRAVRHAFSIAAVTNYPKLSGLNHMNLFL